MQFHFSPFAPFLQRRVSPPNWATLVVPVPGSTLISNSVPRTPMVAVGVVIEYASLGLLPVMR